MIWYLQIIWSLKIQIQDQIKEAESTVEEVDQSRIESCPRELPNSQGLKDHVSDPFKEKESKEVENDQCRTKSDPPEMVAEIVVDVIFCNILETHTDVELITQESKEW